MFQEFLDASSQNVTHFQCPRVAFCFFDGITESIRGDSCYSGAAVCDWTVLCTSLRVIVCTVWAGCVLRACSDVHHNCSVLPLIALSVADELYKANVLVIGPVFPDESAESVQSPLLSAGGSHAHHKAEGESVFAVPGVPTKEW